MGSPRLLYVRGEICQRRDSKRSEKEFCNKNSYNHTVLKKCIYLMNKHPQKTNIKDVLAAWTGVSFCFRGGRLGICGLFKWKIDKCSTFFITFHCKALVLIETQSYLNYPKWGSHSPNIHRHDARRREGTKSSKTKKLEERFHIHLKY